MGNEQSQLYQTKKYEDFQLLRELSRGAFGRVLVVKLKELPEHELIMKRVPYFSEKDKKVADEEVAMLKVAESKHVVRFYGSFIFDVNLCLIMEYCENGNLREQIQKMQSLSLKERKNQCYNIFFNVLMCLKHLHSLGIVHRDLKPENIFLNKNGNAKTGDFGLALKMASRSQVYAAGTLDYQPPEAHTLNKMTDKSDIWSLGVIIIEIIQGVHPYEGKNMNETVQNIINGKFIPLPNYISGDMKEMLLAMINNDPTKRPTAAELLDSELMQLIERFENEKERARIAEQNMHLAEERAILLQPGNEEQRKKADELLKRSQIPCSVVKQIGEDLMKAVVGSESEKKKIMEIQDNDALLIFRTFEGKKDDEGRRKVIQSDVIEGFKLILEKRELNEIPRNISSAFVDITYPSSDEIKLLLFDKKPFPGLLRLLDHTDVYVASDGIVSINNILAGGTQTTPANSLHPQYDAINACSGIDQIMKFFKKNRDKYSKNVAAFCISILFRAREISDKSMRVEIISHLKTLVNDTDEWIKNQAKSRLKQLAQNAVNRAEIESGGFVIPE